MKKLLILLVMAFAVNVVAQESALLRLNYKKGDVYVLEMKMSQDMGTMMSMDMGMKMKQEITSVSGDTYVSKMKIKHILMDMSQGGMNMSYDSSTPENELDASGQAMHGQMGPMLKAVITAKGNNLGEVTETTVEPNIPGTSDLAKQSNSVVYPTEAVRVGDTWDNSKTSQGMVMDFVYKVKSIDSKLVILELTGKVSGGAEGTVTGEVKVDRNSGVPLVSTINMNVNMQGQEMISKVSATMTKQ